MKNIIFIISILIIIFRSEVIAQNCTNANFSLGNFTNWTGWTGTFNACCPTQGIVANRHTIMTTQALDPNSCNGLFIIPPGSTNVARLGNANTGAQAERLTYTLTVDSTNTLFLYKFAVVLESPGHSADDQPSFRARVLNAQGQQLPGVCGEYYVVAGNVPGFIPCANREWRPWTTVGLDLSPYIGQNISVEFETKDCGLGGHYGYAYVSATCQPIKIDVVYCQGQSIVSFIAPEGFSYQWIKDGVTQVGQTTQTYLIPVSTLTGTTQVNCVLTAPTGCQSVLQAQINPTIITPNFSTFKECEDDTIAFTNLSTIYGSTLQSYLWKFGDNTTSTQMSPGKVYQNPGNYFVEMIATAANGCKDTIRDTVVIRPKPSMGYVAQRVCEGNNTVFQDTSKSNSPQPISEYLWTFGDGDSSTIQSPTHLYAGSGLYDVKLWGRNSWGCSDFITRQYRVWDLPIAQWSADTVCHGDTTTFTDLSLQPNDNNLNIWEWRIQNNIINQQNPQYYFSQPGFYPVRLIVAGDHCSDTLEQNILVRSNPKADFAWKDTCQNTPWQFMNTSFNSAEYLWNFSSIGQFTTSNPVVDWSTPGFKTVKLQVKSGDGCFDTITKRITVKALPNNIFYGDFVCEYDTSLFVNKSTGNFYNWDFGDGSHSDHIQPKHFYGINGNYTVKLTVYDTIGCAVEKTMPYIVYDQPEVEFTVADPDGCGKICPTFTNLTVCAEPVNFWLWDFYDGSYATNAQPRHCFVPTQNTYQTFNVKLFGKSIHGCENSIVKENYLTSYPYPDAFANWTSSKTNGSIALDPLITFNDNSTGEPVQWRWLMSDGAIYNTLNASQSHLFKNEGIYTATMIAFNKYGCTDTTELTVRIEKEIKIFIPNSFTPNGDGINEIFKPFGDGIKNFNLQVYNRWGELIFNSNDPNVGWDGTTSKNEIAPVGAYTYKITVSDYAEDTKTYNGVINLLK